MRMLRSRVLKPLKISSGLWCLELCQFAKERLLKLKDGFAGDMASDWTTFLKIFVSPDSDVEGEI